MLRAEPLSIRRRILLLVLALLAGMALALAFLLHDYAQRAAERAFDRLLAAAALTIAGSVQIDDDVSVDLPFSAFALLSGNEHVFYTVRSADGRLVTGYGDLDGALPLAHAADPVFANLRYHGEPVRVATAGRLVLSGGRAGWVTVRVAETLGARTELADEILGRSVLPLALLALAAFGLLAWGVRRALAPLVRIEQALRQRAPGDLSALATPVPIEVRGLVEALNAFMRRLSEAMDTLKTLVAEAAHQVRTPLASLRAQAEVALDETDPRRLRERLGRIFQNATLASQLANQLLMEATIAHRLGRGRHEPVPLAEVIGEVHRLVASLDVPRLSVRVAPEIRSDLVAGDRIALREMLRNLVDNALAYAPGSPVEIHLDPVAGGRVALVVTDRGPGIADDEKLQVQERFRRGRHGASLPGSGLGLAIARSVAVAHGGELALLDRPGGGLVARVVLPLATRPTAAPGLAASACLVGVLVAAAALGSPRGAWADAAPPAAGIVTRFEAPRAAGLVLTVAGPTDTSAVAPLVRGFQARHPDISVVYRELDSRPLFDAMVAGRLPDVDVVMSSAADLQLRLANDGFAQSYNAPGAARLPPWAVWRREVFGFTFEPVVIVYNPRRYDAATVPRSREALLRALEAPGNPLRGRVGTYDIAQSSVGHLLAEQDALVSSNFWGLVNAMGRVGVHLSATSGAVLDAVERGELDLGYNVLGSYALARQAAGRSIGVVLPRDYVLVLARSVLIARTAPHADLGRAFVDWLLSPAGQEAVARHAALGALVGSSSGAWAAQAVLARAQGIVQPVAFSPALLVGVDPHRQAHFIRNWHRLVTDTPPVPGR